MLKNITQVQFEITNRCNLHCDICWRTLREESQAPKDMSFKNFKTALEKLLMAGTLKEINTQGLGEPLLCPEVLEILRLAKSKGLAVWFVTNGTQITDDMAKHLVEIAVDKVRISIDSADEKTYSEIKRGSSLKTVTENMERINRYKKAMNSDYPRMALNSVAGKKTLGGVRNLLEMAKNHKVEEVTLIPLVNFSKGSATPENQIDFDSEIFRKEWGPLQEKAHELGVELNLGISMETKDRKFCHQGIYVDVEGWVRPCCNITRGLSFGNLFEEELACIQEKRTCFLARHDWDHIECKECNQHIDKVKREA